MKIRFSIRAARELREAGVWIARDNPERAAQFIEAIERATLGIGQTPRGFPIVERFARQGIRKRSYGNYLIYYRIDTHQVTILRILHGARDQHSLLVIEDDDD